MVNTRDFLRQHSLKPKQSLAQNFLVDESHLARIAAAASLSKDEIVLEIGPGPGSLTAHLAEQAGRIVAVELDNRLIEPLQQQFAEQSQVTIIHGDILEIAPGALIEEEIGVWEGVQDATHRTERAMPIARSVPPYKVVANLPYYITSAVLRHLLEAAAPPTVIVVLVQKEVAERICATPGNLSLLAVSVQFYAKPTLVHHVPASAFYPQPKVDSAVLRLDCYPAPAVPAVAPQDFFRVVRAGFSQKRKQLRNTISAGLHLPKAIASELLTAAEIDPKRRAETLTLDEWGALCTEWLEQHRVA